MIIFSVIAIQDIITLLNVFRYSVEKCDTPHKLIVDKPVNLTDNSVT